MNITSNHLEIALNLISNHVSIAINETKMGRFNRAEEILSQIVTMTEDSQLMADKLADAAGQD